MNPRRSDRIVAREAKKESETNQDIDQAQDEVLRQLRATLNETLASNENIEEFNASLLRDINILKTNYYRLIYGCENHHKHRGREVYDQIFKK